MKSIRTIAYYRTDLKDQFKEIPYSDIVWEMFSISNTGVILHEDIALFIDDDGATKIIKNRFNNK